MPIARVQLPDGNVARLEVPDGVTPQQVEAFVFEKLNSTQGTPRPAPQAATAPERPVEAPDRLERFGRGFADLTQGAKQGYLMLKDFVTGGNEAAQYTAEKTAENALYERGRQSGAMRTLSDLVTGAKPDPGMDWMRLGGNVTGTLPLAAVPGGSSMSLLTRMASGAASGGASSALMFTPEGESKAGQIATGAVLGAAVPAAITGIKSGVGRVMDWARPRINVSIPEQAQRLMGDLQVKLQQQGLDWNKLTGDVRQSLLDDAAKTLNAGGTLDDVMLQRKALIESVGAKPTRAAVTRSPRDWQAEKNLRGISGVGDEIVTREQTNAQAMAEYLQKLRSGTGGKPGTALDAGESAVVALRAADAEKEKAVKGLYDAFRASGAQDAAVPDVKIADALGRVADEIGTENVPAAVLNRLKEFGFVGGQRTKLLTVNEADKLNRLINNNNPGHGPASAALARVKSAVNEALLDVEPAGKQGVEALKQARAAAAARFAEQDASGGIRAAVDDVAPDRFVQKFVIGAPVRDMKATLAELAKGPQGQQAVKDVKGHVLDTLLLKATGATSVDDVAGKPFSGVRFSKALDAIEPEKLHALYSPSEVEALRNLQKASKLLTEEVAFSDVNHSKTSAALANLLLKVGNTPMLGQLVSPIIGTARLGLDWVKDANARKQVAEILIGSAGKAGERAVLPPGLFERLAPAAAAAAAEKSQRANQ